MSGARKPSWFLLLSASFFFFFLALSVVMYLFAHCKCIYMYIYICMCALLCGIVQHVPGSGLGVELSTAPSRRRALLLHRSTSRNTCLFDRMNLAVFVVAAVGVFFFVLLSLGHFEGYLRTLNL